MHGIYLETRMSDKILLIVNSRENIKFWEELMMYTFLQIPYSIQ
jgi:hypothetical protein